jgi:hypothetical protein
MAVCVLRLSWHSGERDADAKNAGRGSPALHQPLGLVPRIMGDGLSAEPCLGRCSSPYCQLRRACWDTHLLSSDN